MVAIWTAILSFRTISVVHWKHAMWSAHIGGTSSSHFSFDSLDVHCHPGQTLAGRCEFFETTCLSELVEFEFFDTSQSKIDIPTTRIILIDLFKKSNHAHALCVASVTSSIRTSLVTLLIFLNIFLKPLHWLVLPFDLDPEPICSFPVAVASEIRKSTVRMFVWFVVHDLMYWLDHGAWWRALTCEARHGESFIATAILRLICTALLELDDASVGTQCTTLEIVLKNTNS